MRVVHAMIGFAFGLAIAPFMPFICSYALFKEEEGAEKPCRA